MQRINTTVTIKNAAHCQALVRSLYPQANGAQFSNVGDSDCWAVFNACAFLLDLALLTYLCEISMIHCDTI